MSRAAGLAIALLLSAGPAARAQNVAGGEAQAKPALTLTLFPGAADTLDSVVVRAAHLLEDPVFDGALKNGFPVRYHFSLQLWQLGFLFDRLSREAQWDAVVRLDPLTGEYDVVRSGGGRAVTHFTSLEAANRALSTPFRVELLPRAGRGARYYYLATLDISSLSLTELEEVERWLQGDVGPTMQPKGNFGDALADAARRLLIRFSGLPRRRLEQRSPTFEAGR